MKKTWNGYLSDNIKQPDQKYLSIFRLPGGCRHPNFGYQFNKQNHESLKRKDVSGYYREG
ncbi:hypothetical protein SAMN04487996_1255 [Dyadobacter soli]|uniref:Uncharacterized protein n=1 Tax=Dyadobacter soli TaxID=659014 RepID=A0A1G7XYU9_9BACT|nr:hypothetical protein SAMN04487996_1255 [Dyadobacter soli]